MFGLALAHTDPAAPQRNLNKLVEALARFDLKAAGAEAKGGRCRRRKRRRTPTTSTLVNVKKTVPMSLNARDGHNAHPETRFVVHGSTADRVDKFDLGRAVGSDASRSARITRRIGRGTAPLRRTQATARDVPR